MKRSKHDGRRYRSLNFRDLNKGKVEVDAEGRVFLRGEEVSPIVVESRFHFFQAEIEPVEWERVRKFYDLPMKKRHTRVSYGVRRGEGRKAGLGTFPRRNIADILEERNCASGEESFSVDYRKIDKMVREDMKKWAKDGSNETQEENYSFDIPERPF